MQEQRNNYQQPQSEFHETVIEINRVSKKTKGGNQMRFSALVVIGDKKGRVAVGLGKAPNVVAAIRKSVSFAKKHLITINIKNGTIPYEVNVKYGAAKIMMKPARVGVGIVAGGPLRALFEAAGIKDIVAKILGSNNKATNLYGAIIALKNIERFSEKIATMKGK